MTDDSKNTEETLIGETIASGPLKMAAAEVIEYQKNAIVSKIILKKNMGSVTAFAFDQGQELSEHTTPYNALLQVLDGESEVTVSGKKYNLQAGDMILLPAGKPHAVKAIKSFKMFLTMIRS